MKADVRTAGGMFLTAPTHNALGVSCPKVNKERESAAPALGDSDVLASSRPPAPESAARPQLSCGGIIPAAANLQSSLNIMHRYVCPAQTAEYQLNQLGNTLNYNLFSLNCTRVGIVRERRSCRGVRCNECQQMWTNRSSYYKKLVNKWGEKLSTAERCLNAPYLSDADGIFMHNFCHHNTIYLKVNTHGNNLRELIQQRYEFYRTAKVRCLETHS